MPFKLCAWIGLWVTLSLANASYAQGYQPKPVHSVESKELIASLNLQLSKITKRVRGANRKKIVQSFKERTNNLIKQVKDGHFIDDDTINTFMSQILDRLSARNNFKNPVKTLLVSGSPNVNAYCIGEGTIVINVGLIARLQNESQLAFIIAHEMAHQELDHVYTRTVNYYDTSKKLKDDFRDLMSPGDLELEQVDVIKDFGNNLGRHSREAELAADSLGLKFMLNSDYDHQAALEVLSVLDSAQFPRVALGDHIFDQLTFPKYPFKTSWLKKRPGVSSKPPRSFFYHVDSLVTHPDIQIRQVALNNYIKSQGASREQPTHLMQKIIQEAKYEGVEGAFRSEDYDISLHEALQLKSELPQDSYLAQAIARIFISLFEAKNKSFMINTWSPTENGKWNKVLNRNYYYQREALEIVNSLLVYIPSEDLATLAFHFMNHKDNFDTDSRAHYVSLWKISTQLGRSDVAIKVRESYRKKYGDDEDFREMF